MIPNMTRVIRSSLLLLTLLMLGVVNSQAAPDMPPTMVETLTVGQFTNRPTLDAVGTLKALNGIVLRPEIAGRITRINFDSGQVVKKGDLLLQLNPIILQAQYDTAKTRLNLSEKTAERYQKLVESKVISKEDYDKAMATLMQDKAQLEEATARLEYTYIRAPFAGKLGLRQVSLGDYVQAGQALVNLQSQDPILVEFALPETQIGRIRPGQTLTLKSDVFAGQLFKGEVAATESQIDPTTRTLMVQAKVNNPEHKLIPGAFVAVSLDLGQAERVLRIPQSAIIYDAGQAFVFRVIQQKANKTKVNLGAKSASEVVVLSGLAMGDVIVTAGQHKLMDGAPVMDLAKARAN